MLIWFPSLKWEPTSSDAWTSLLSKLTTESWKVTVFCKLWRVCLINSQPSHHVLPPSVQFALLLQSPLDATSVGDTLLCTRSVSFSRTAMVLLNKHEEWLSLSIVVINHKGHNMELNAIYPDLSKWASCITASLEVSIIESTALM